MMDKSLKGPERRTYYDMNPWYEKNKAQGVHDWHQHVGAADIKLLTHLKQLISDLKPSSILEVGCGGGDFTFKYSIPGVRHLAFDFSTVAVEMAKRKENPNEIEFMAGDGLDLSFLNGEKFDLILAKDVLHCILGEDRKRFFHNIAAALAEDGLALLTTHIGLPDNDEVLKYVNPVSRENHLQTRVYYDEVHIDAEMEDAGLEVLEKFELPGQLIGYQIKRISIYPENYDTSLRGSSVSIGKLEIRPAHLSQKRNIFSWLCESDFTQEIMGAPQFPEHPVPTWNEFDRDYDNSIYFSDDQPLAGRSYVIYSNGEEVGHVGYNTIDEKTSSVELDIWLSSRKLAGKGIGSFALSWLTNHLSDELGVKYFLVQPTKRNPGAIACYRKAGFVPIEMSQNSDFIGIYESEYADSYWMRKTASKVGS